MTFAGIVRSSLVDYPGLVSCVLFVPGCNYDCFYCHNRSLIDGSYEEISPKNVKEFLLKRVGQLDGIVITGGEPTLQPDLIAYIQEIKAQGYKVKLDTNGSSPHVIEKLIESELCDYYAVDYKAPANRYQEICRGSANAEKVRQTIRILLDNNVDFEVRTTVIPQLNEHDLLVMAQELPIVPRYVFNRFRKPEKYLASDQTQLEQTPYSQEQIIRFTNLVRPYQPNIET